MSGIITFLELPTAPKTPPSSSFHLLSFYCSRSTGSKTGPQHNTAATMIDRYGALAVKGLTFSPPNILLLIVTKQLSYFFHLTTEFSSRRLFSLFMSSAENFSRVLRREGEFLERGGSSSWSKTHLTVDTVTCLPGASNSLLTCCLVVFGWLLTIQFVLILVQWILGPVQYLLWNGSKGLSWLNRNMFYQINTELLRLPHCSVCGWVQWAWQPSPIKMGPEKSSAVINHHHSEEVKRQHYKEHLTQIPKITRTDCSSCCMYTVCRL